MLRWPPSSEFHVSNAVFLPRPPKHDTVSHPVKAWKKGKALCLPSALAFSCPANNLKFLPVARATHNSSMLRRWADATERTTTSVPTVRTDNLIYPCFTAYSTWSGMRVSAYSCVHGASPSTVCFSVSLAAICMARKENSSNLFMSIRINACQFLGMELDGSTRLRIPLPRFFRLAAFKLSAIYSSKTTSTLLTGCNWYVTYGRTPALHIQIMYVWYLVPACWTWLLHQG